MNKETALAEFVASADIDHLPAEVVASIRRLLLDAIASALAGHRSEDVAAVARLARELFGDGEATVIGDNGLSAAGAAFVNGFQVTAATICDVHRPTLTHVSPEVVPAALAAVDMSQGTGADLLAAVAAGSEVAVRVAEALDDDGYRRRRWHNPGIAGAIGAAAAAARVFRLDTTGVRHAFGHAVSQAAGTLIAVGTSSVKFHQARGALAGLLAARLSAEGFDAAPDSLTGAHGGLLATYADGGNPVKLTAGLGTEFRLSGLSLRRWPGASSLQAVIAATFSALDRMRDEPIAEGRVDLPPRGHALHAGAGWSNRLSALQSPRWIVAVIVHDRTYWVDQTAPERLRDPTVADLAQRISVSLDPTLPEGGARVTLISSSGKVVRDQIDVPPGDPGAPLTEINVLDKLHHAAASVPGLDASAVVAAVADLASDIAGLARLRAALAPAPPGASLRSAAAAQSSPLEEAGR